MKDKNKMKNNSMRKKRKIFSILSFIMPFVSVFLTIIGGGEMFGLLIDAPLFVMRSSILVFPLAGIIFGIIGLTRKENGKGFAIAGILLNFLLALFYSLILFYLGSPV